MQLYTYVRENLATLSYTEFDYRSRYFVLKISYSRGTRKATNIHKQVASWLFVIKIRVAFVEHKSLSIGHTLANRIS